MSSSCISALDRLELLGRRLLLNSLVEHVRTLKMDLMFLRTIVDWILSVPSEESFKQKLRDLREAYWSINNNIMELYPTYGPQPVNVNVKISRILEKVKHIKPNVKEVCSLHLEIKYSRSSWLFQSDYITKYIGDLQDNLKDLFSLKGSAITPVIKQMEVLMQKLRFLTDLTEFTAKHSKGAVEVEDLMIHIRTVTDHVTLLSYSYLGEEMDELMAREINCKLSDLLEDIKLINPEVKQIYVRAYKSLHPSDSPWTDLLEVVCLIDFLLLDLMELLHHDTSFVVPMKDQIGNLSEKMIFLRQIIVDLPVQHKTKKFQHLMRSIHEKIREVGPFYSIFAGETDEDAARDRNSALLDLLESIELVEAEFRKINLHKFPSTDELRCIDVFLENLVELLTRKTELISSVKPQIVTLHTELLDLRSIIGKMREMCSENEKIKDVWRRVTVMAYRAEFVVDSIAVGDHPACYHMLQLSTVIEEIKLIKAEVKDTYDEACETALSSVERTSSRVSLQGTTPNIPEMVMGFKNEEEILKNRLIEQKKDLEVIAIVGMPGLGKTTLAKKLYNDLTIQNKFDVCAWCCVSRTCASRDLLLELLGLHIELTNNVHEKNDEELAELLYKSLKGQRYLIVLDDVWDIVAWNALRRSFPDDKNDSRILITSRFHDMALQTMPENNIHSLRRFNDDESLMLLKEKLFLEQDCSKKLLEAGKQIAKNCKGLPLAVVLAAGLLSRMEKTESQWQYFAETLTAHVVSAPSNECMPILELSYRHLPDHLKSCFLYFGAFQGDKEISVRKLTWLWTAEGFLQNMKLETLEEIAEHYLIDLIGRSLVTGTKCTSMGRVKACHVHDTVRDFCLGKAEEENFLHYIHDYDITSPPIDHGLDNGVHPDYSETLSLLANEQYRLSIYSGRKQFIMGRPLGLNVRSLFLHTFGHTNRNNPYDAAYISRCLKLIRILDLECINIGDSFSGIELLVHLRFLAVMGDMVTIPSSMVNLWRLETFLLKQSRGKVVVVPDSIWNMARLRHVHIDDHASFKLNQQIVQNPSLLENLQTFSTPSLTYGDDGEKLLRSMPKLRKLRCIFLDSWNDSNECNQFPVLNFLSQLVSLKIFGNNISPSSAQRHPCKFDLPLNLRKLTLSDLRLPWSEISSIGGLPNLEVLKLLCRAFEGESWNMEEGGFLKLKHLKLESLNIVEWKATSNHIPSLERLVLQKCKKLKEIPSSFEDIKALQMIDVQGCSTSARTSARNILQKKNEMERESQGLHLS